MSAYKFYPGAGPPPNIPLSRFLPKFGQGAVTSWLSDHVPDGSL